VRIRHAQVAGYLRPIRVSSGLLAVVTGRLRAIYGFPDETRFTLTSASTVYIPRRRFEDAKRYFELAERTATILIINLQLLNTYTMSQRHTDKDKDEKKHTHSGRRQKTTPKKKRDDEDSEVPSTRSATNQGNLGF
jgi:hypothetical protein